MVRPAHAPASIAAAKLKAKAAAPAAEPASPGKHKRRTRRRLFAFAPLCLKTKLVAQQHMSDETNTKARLFIAATRSGSRSFNERSYETHRRKFERQRLMCSASAHELVYALVARHATELVRKAATVAVKRTKDGALRVAKLDVQHLQAVLALGVPRLM